VGWRQITRRPILTCTADVAGQSTASQKAGGDYDQRERRVRPRTGAGAAGEWSSWAVALRREPESKRRRYGKA
jgi:hypothetical protein